MATLGKTTTPTYPTFGWYGLTAKQVACLYTVPAGGGFFQSVSFWAATDASPSDYIWGVIWDSSGNVLANGSGVLTGGGATGGTNVGSTQWYTDTFSTPIWLAGGTQIYIGWQPNSSTRQTDWAFNGNDHSPDAEMHSGSGSPSSFAGHSLMNNGGNHGAVASYATYTPGSIYADDGAAFQGGVIAYADDGAAWQQCEVYVDDGSAWQRIG